MVMSYDLNDLMGLKIAPVKRDGIKRCRYCKTPLNMYNKTEDCHSHTQRGILEDGEKAEKKVINVKKKARKKFWMQIAKYVITGIISIILARISGMI